jgi:hypothetical protein
MGLAKMLAQLARLSHQDAVEIVQKSNDQKRDLSTQEKAEINALLDDREAALDEAKKRGWGLG